MKAQQFKILITLFFFGLLTVSAQKLEKKYTEKFNVNKDVVIDVNTRYTDIEIETWDKNEVIIEAYISIKDDIEQQLINEYMENWKFEALGNKSTIKVSSKSSGLFDIHTFNFDSPDYDVVYPSDIQHSLKNLEYVIPEFPELPEIPEMPELPDLPEVLLEMPVMPDLPELPPMPSQFDYKAYKKDKSYLERWKKENKDIIGENATVKVGRNTISIKADKDHTYSYRWSISTDGQNENANEIKERIEKSREAREKAHVKRLEATKKRQEALRRTQKLVKEKVKERSEQRKLALVKRQEAYEKRAKEMKERRSEVKDILKKREKMNIKRIIKIKAPKNAKFNMNVRYGSISFPN